MSISLTNQVYVFLMSAVCGVLVSAVFDVFRAIRTKCRRGIFAVGAEDILFWLISAGIFFAFMYNTNSGEPRLFIFCGAVLGAGVYVLIVGNFMVKVFAAVGAAAAAAICFVLKILLWPVMFFMRLVKRPMLFVTLRVRGTAKRAYKSAKKLCLLPKKIKKRLKMY